MKWLHLQMSRTSTSIICCCWSLLGIKRSKQIYNSWTSENERLILFETRVKAGFRSYLALSVDFDIGQVMEPISPATMEQFNSDSKMMRKRVKITGPSALVSLQIPDLSLTSGHGHDSWPTNFWTETNPRTNLNTRESVLEPKSPRACQPLAMDPWRDRSLRLPLDQVVWCPSPFGWVIEHPLGWVVNS